MKYIIKKIVFFLLYSQICLGQNDAITGKFIEYKRTLANGEDGSLYTFDNKPFQPSIYLIFEPAKKTVVIINDGNASEQLYSIFKNGLSIKTPVFYKEKIDTLIANYSFERLENELILKEKVNNLNDKYYLKIYYLKQVDSIVKTEKAHIDTIYSKVDTLASFPGGITAFQKFVLENLEIPKDLRGKKYNEKVYVELTINKLGKIINCELKGYPKLEFAAESIKFIRKLPNWIPAKIGNQPVNSYFKFPISFTQN